VLREHLVRRARLGNAEFRLAAMLLQGANSRFVRVIDERTIAHPLYDGNGTYRSLGNAEWNPRGWGCCLSISKITRVCGSTANFARVRDRGVPEVPPVYPYAGVVQRSRLMAVCWAIARDSLAGAH
jgi:hypothetical protein